jgi:hypothetical protein
MTMEDATSMPCGMEHVKQGAMWHCGGIDVEETKKFGRL